MPIVILGADLRIRRVTPAAQRLLNVLPGDVGRRLTDLRHEIELPGLEAAVRAVVETMTAHDIDARGADGGTYSVCLRPYTMRDGRVDAILMTWEDGDSGRVPVQRAYRDAAEALLGSLAEPAAIVGENLRFERENEAWRARFRSAAGRRLAEWGGEDLEAKVRGVIAGTTGTESARVEHGNAEPVEVRVSRFGGPNGPGSALLTVVDGASDAG